jgi:hypothetical protein
LKYCDHHLVLVAAAAVLALIPLPLWLLLLAASVFRHALLPPSLWLLYFAAAGQAMELCQAMHQEATCGEHVQVMSKCTVHPVVKMSK